MKFDFEKAFEAERARRAEWHRWFAWRPVKVSDKSWRWLEYVERRGDFYGGYHSPGWVWEFRPLK